MIFPICDDLASSCAFDGIGILAPSPNITFLLLKHICSLITTTKLSQKQEFLSLTFSCFPLCFISLSRFACSLISCSLVFLQGVLLQLDFIKVYIFYILFFPLYFIFLPLFSCSLISWSLVFTRGALHQFDFVKF